MKSLLRIYRERADSLTKATCRPVVKLLESRPKVHMQLVASKGCNTVPSGSSMVS